MALEDLEGKRTGRPPGARTTSPVRRDILWAYRNLDKPDVKPPSPGAKMWLDLARQEQGRFLSCIALFEASRQEDPSQEEASQPMEVPVPAQEPPKAPARGFGDSKTRRVMSKILREDEILSLIEHRPGATGSRSRVPYDAHVVDCEANVSQRVFHVFIASETFREVPEGQPIPDLPTSGTV